MLISTTNNNKLNNKQLKEKNKMNQDQITALAREYAEEQGKLDREQGFPEFFIKDMLVFNEKGFKSVLEFLLRHFYLVEKSKATELCRLTLDHGDSVDYGLIDSLTDIVCDIFSEQYQQVAENKSTNPEIAKEMEK